MSLERWEVGEAGLPGEVEGGEAALPLESSLLQGGKTEKLLSLERLREERQLSLKRWRVAGRWREERYSL